MSFASGVYSLPGPALNTGDTVSATENNTFRNDVATAFNLTWLRNGTAAATADIPMGGFSFTNCAAVGSNGSLLLKVNNGTTAATLDTSGNLGLGVTPSAWSGARAFQIGTSGVATTALWDLSNNTFLTNGAYWNGTAYKYIASSFPAARYVQTSGAHTWSTAAGGTAGNDIIFTQAMTLNASGQLLVGTTSGTDVGRVVSSGVANSYPAFRAETGATTSQQQISFVNPNGVVGTITTSGSATAYNTSSDYRLKNTIAPMAGALAKVGLLKPCTYKWNTDGSDGEGFIAHELAEVVPQCVTGEKDEVDADGNPKYQGIDTSFLVATLTAAIQELKAEFDAYKASHP
jgi:hypothetical protein